MENTILQQQFLDACIKCHVLSTKNGDGTATPLCKRKDVKTHIAYICGELGIDVSSDDVDLVFGNHGSINKTVLAHITTASRSLVTVALVAFAIRYIRSRRLPTIQIVEWVRSQVSKIKKQELRPSCKKHRAFVDLYDLVNANVFVHVPIDSEE